MEEGLAEEFLQQVAHIKVNVARVTRVTSPPASGTCLSLAATIHIVMSI